MSTASAPRGLTGRRFGRWTVGPRATREERRKASGKPVVYSEDHLFWWCRCTCGTWRIVSGQTLVQGRSRGCVPCRNKDTHQGVFTGEDLTGRVFGEWTVLGFSHRNARHVKWWLCRCTCGHQKPVEGRTLTAGRSTRCKSCANRNRPRPASSSPAL